MFSQALGLDLSADGPRYIRWLLSQQRQDGLWSIAPDYPGDVSTSSQVCFALKLPRLPTEQSRDGASERIILRSGGVTRVRVLSRIYSAHIGLLPWDAVPHLPVELNFMPSQSPINISTFKSWARSVIVPLLILQHHQPIYALPSGRHTDNNFIDELWLNAKDKMPHDQNLCDTWRRNALARLSIGKDKIFVVFWRS